MSWAWADVCAPTGWLTGRARPRTRGPTPRTARECRVAARRRHRCAWHRLRGLAKHKLVALRADFLDLRWAPPGGAAPGALRAPGRGKRTRGATKEEWEEEEEEEEEDAPRWPSPRKSAHGRTMPSLEASEGPSEQAILALLKNALALALTP
ncbi:unnamed protein product [Prorocentrum cordatum]|uniref:Uncharacterized protein n=1 Tax=Prorocentrum cordatum TaxID=2364126 RepID=A0ABN9YH73_9DINO|nr:unnamed protein product [Polarella glacialis]